MSTVALRNLAAGVVPCLTVLGYYVPGARAGSMTQVIARWREFLPEIFVVPHPSWRTTSWLRDNAWFEAEALPELRARVAVAINPPPRSAPCRRR